MKMLRVITFLLVGVVAALCQIAGQSPGGQYPGGQYPGQSPIPRVPGTTNPTGRPRTGQPKQQPDSRSGRSSSSNALLTTTTGILRRATSNQLVIQSDDHRVIWYRLTPQVTVQKETKDASLSEFAPGDYLSVDSNSDDEGIMTAVSVTWKKVGTPEDRAEASKTWDLPRLETALARSSAKSTSSPSSPPREAGDERPVLRRKDSPAEPAKEPAAKNDEPKEVAKAAPPEQAEPEIVVPATVMKPPDPKPDADDPGKPALRRGVPAPRPQTQSASTTSAEPASPPVPAKAPANEVVPQPVPAVIPVQDDPIIAKQLEEIGCVAVMPLASLIGSGMGILNPWNLQIIIENAKVPVLVDAGVGTASDAAIAMELGCDGVLMNTGIAGADDPIAMAEAMNFGVRAGRLAHLAGRIPRKLYASASSPLTGAIE